MSFAWHDHHFINRHLALDFANTVVYRHRPPRREDRMSSLARVDSWRRACGIPLGRDPRSTLREIVGTREIIDRFFRHVFLDERPDPRLWAQIVRSYARHVPAALDLAPAGMGVPANAGNGRAPAFLAAIVHSAVELAFSPELARVKVCPSCGWLFIDRTRNGRKKWCITALCGNRSKARRHYERHKVRPRRRRFDTSSRLK